MQTRRRLLFALMSLPLLPKGTMASNASAVVVAASGGGEVVTPEGVVQPLVVGMPLASGARLRTGRAGLAQIALADGTQVNAGADTLLDLAASDSVASLNVSGLAVVDRRQASREPAIITARSDGSAFEVLLADARVFLDSVEGGAVFVKDGMAEVRSDQAVIMLASGQGVDLQPVPVVEPGASVEPDPAPPPPGSALPAHPLPVPPPPVVEWGETRVADAFAAVGLSA